MKDTRQEILAAAKELFNQRGYNSVSMQDIADVVGISKGNLTYHFKKKEDLIEAIVLQMHQSYGGKQPAPPQTLVELNGYFLRVQRHTAQNAYYFWHYTQFAQLSSKIKAIQAKVTQNRYDLLTNALQTLCAAGLVEAPAYPGHHQQVVQALHIVCVYYTPQSKMEQEFKTPGSFLGCAWGLLYALLTPKGQQIYKEQIQPQI